MNEVESAPLWLAADALQRLIELLGSRGYRVVGPTVSQQAIVYDEIDSVEDLPRGWTDVQAPGEYRLVRRADDALFGFVVGPQSWKQFLFPPQACVASAERTDKGWHCTSGEQAPPRYALLGVRRSFYRSTGLPACAYSTAMPPLAMHMGPSAREPDRRYVCDTNACACVRVRACV